MNIIYIGSDEDNVVGAIALTYVRCDACQNRLWMIVKQKILKAVLPHMQLSHLDLVGSRAFYSDSGICSNCVYKLQDEYKRELVSSVLEEMKTIEKYERIYQYLLSLELTEKAKIPEFTMNPIKWG